VLPRANGVLETLLRKLARGLSLVAVDVRRLHLSEPFVTSAATEIKRAGSALDQRRPRGLAVRQDPAHAISTKNKHLLLACATNPRFHGGCFGVWGTPPPKPLKCKSVSNRLGARFRRDGQTPPVERLSIPAPEFVWHCRTSSRRHFSIVHRLFTFRYCHSLSVSGQQKTLLTLR